LHLALTPELERQWLIITQSKGKEKSMGVPSLRLARIAKFRWDELLPFVTHETRQIQENHDLRASLKRRRQFWNETSFGGQANYGVFAPV
jgi:hypothetical protein